jgi:hypothetical protein
MRPTAAATNADAPPSGISPTCVKASMKNAFSEANTTSHARARDTPTPAAGPWTTATTGRGKAVMARMARLAAAMISDPRPPPAKSSSLIPAPEQKPRPEPPRRTTLTSGSVAACSIASAIPFSTPVVTELRLSGRSRVTDNTPSESVTVRPATGASVSIADGIESH